MRGRMRALVLVGALLGAGAVGYAVYRVARPPLRIQSDRVVRGFVRDASREVRKLRQRLRRLRREGRLTAAEADRLGAGALERVESLAEAARDRIDAMDLHFQTQRNRLERIDARLKQTEEYLREIVAEAKGRLGAPAGTRGPGGG